MSDKVIWYVQSRHPTPGADWHDEAWSEDQAEAGIYMQEHAVRSKELDWRITGPLRRVSAYTPIEMEVKPRQVVGGADPAVAMAGRQIDILIQGQEEVRRELKEAQAARAALEEMVNYKPVVIEMVRSDYGPDIFDVVYVENTVEWVPGNNIRKEWVEKICARHNWTVRIR